MRPRVIILIALLITALGAIDSSVIGGSARGATGDTWTLRTQASSQFNSNWSSVAFGNGTFVAVAASSSALPGVMTSTDGITWTAAPFS
ncbi:MAG: hypothetical protein FJ361_10490, partial [Gemmatimonadetes bacterium]|nr:hypothetical protein [Gemmatimonadota bacterium]